VGFVVDEVAIEQFVLKEFFCYTLHNNNSTIGSVVIFHRLTRCATAKTKQHMAEAAIRWPLTAENWVCA
jgi:hypothetical protein